MKIGSMIKMELTLQRFVDMLSALSAREHESWGQVRMYSFIRDRFLPLAAILLAAFALFGAGVADARADETFLGAISLLDDPQVASQLDLSAETAAKLKELVDARESAAIELTLSIKNLPADERSAKLAEFRDESESQGLALLSADQQTKLKQIQIGKAGVQALADSAVIEQLALSDEQKTKVASLLEELQRATSQGSEAQRRFARARLERELVEVLSPEQKANWDKLTGRLSAEATIPMASDKPASSGSAAEATTAEKPENSGSARSTNRQAASGSRTDAKAGKASNESSAVTTKSGDVKLKFNFRYAPWKDVLDWFAEQADLSLVVDAPPQGTFNYSDSRAYTPSEAIDLLNGVLLTKGYTLVRRERMLMLVNLEDGVPPNLVPQVALTDLDKKGEFELVSVLFQLNKMTPEEAEPELRKLIGPQGAIIMLPKARQVLVTETAGKLRTIRSVIESVENPQIPKDEKVAVIELKFVTPGEFLPVARQLLGMPENVNSTPDGTLRLATDELGNRVLATGKNERLERLQEIVKLIDIASPGDESAGGPIEQPQLEVYSVTGADPAAVLQVLQTLLSGLPDVRLTTDPQTGNLVALAKPSQHATIKATLDQLQRDGTQVEVIKLRRLDPQAAVLAINKLFGGADGAPAANGPKVDADPTNMQLMIRGNAAQVTQIRDLLTKMGENGEGTLSDKIERTNVRILPLTGRSADSALQQIESVWPTLHRNKIRIVRPSQTSTQIKTRGVPPLESQQMEEEKDAAAEEPGLDQATRNMIEEMLQSVDRPILRSPNRTGPRSPATAPAQPRVPATNPPASNRDNAPTTGKSTWRMPTLPGGLHFVAQINEAQGESSDAETVVPSTRQPAITVDPVDVDPATEEVEEKTVPGADIVVTIGPGGLMLASEDLDALDEFEELLRGVAESTAASGREYTVFYLKYARAEVAATLLQEAIGGGVPGGDDEGGSLMGDIASSMMGDAGGGLLGGLLGLGGGGGGGGTASSSASGGVSVIPDPRLNALMVLAKPKDLDMIEQLLQVIDQQASPENPQTVAAPRFIPVLNTSAEEIATVVRQVYAARLAADASQPRQPSPEDLIRALRGGRGGRGGGAGGGQNNRGEEQKMTIGVDSRTNSLIVSAPEYLFQEVKKLVAELDSSVVKSDETIRVVTLKRANADLVQRSLISVLGDSATTNKTGASTSTGSQAGRTGPNSSNRRSGQPSGQSPDQMRQMQQQAEFLQNLQRGMGGGGGNRGGGGGGQRGGGGGGFRGGR
jgi:type II secretory pathway component GspD/PulD (secretin)